MSCSCVTQVPYCITKGTTFESVIAFTSAYVELIEDPQDYSGNLVFREYQEAEAPVYLILSSTIDTSQPEAPAQMVFTATPTQTLALPDWDCVAYCELTNTVTGDVSRLFDGEVTINE